MARDPRRRSMPGKKAVLIALAVVVFVAADIALVVGATSSHSSTESTTPAVRPTFVATEPSSPIDSVPAPALAPASRLLAAVDGEVAWRTTAGSCPTTNAVIERSTDGGRTWDGFDLGSTGGLSVVASLQASGDVDSVFLTANSKADCGTTSWVETTNAGETWSAYPDRVVTAWYVDQSNRAVVHAPNAVHAAPCLEVVGLASANDVSGAVLCSDRSLYRTSDSGVTWVEAPELQNAVAIGRAEGGYLVLQTSPEATCIGYSASFLAIGTSEPGKATSGCIDTGGASSDVAISGNADAWWLWSGSFVVRSSDNGKTWR